MLHKANHAVFKVLHNTVAYDFQCFDLAVIIQHTAASCDIGPERAPDRAIVVNGHFTLAVIQIIQRDAAVHIQNLHVFLIIPDRQVQFIQFLACFQRQDVIVILNIQFVIMRCKHTAVNRAAGHITHIVCIFVQLKSAAQDAAVVCHRAGVFKDSALDYAAVGNELREGSAGDTAGVVHSGGEFTAGDAFNVGHTAGEITVGDAACVGHNGGEFTTGNDAAVVNAAGKAAAGDAALMAVL